MKKIVGIVALTAAVAGVGILPAQAAVSTNNDADIVDGNAFVRSSWVQAGLKEDGSFGSSIAAPSGYNSLTIDGDEGFLGLIEDTNEDGFDGDGDAGDFFLPGSPYEAWGLKVDGGTPYQNSGGAQIPGSWTASETSGDASVTWTSTDTADSIGVVQKVEAPANGDHLFKVTVSLTNTDSVAHTAYYTRQVDADNAVDPMLRAGEEDGSYDTFNLIVAQSDASQIVTSTSYYNYSTIGYRSADADATVRISDWSWPLEEGMSVEDSDAALAADEAFYKVGAQDFLDSTIDITFRKEIAAGATETFTFDYILSPGLVDVPEYALDLALDLTVGGDYADAATALAGGGLAPNSEYTLTEFSVPSVLFTGTTLPNGNFYDETSLPTECRPGSHRLLLQGTSPSGQTVSDMVTYTVDENCVVTAFDPYALANGVELPVNELAETGFETTPWLVSGGLLTALAAGAAIAIRRRKA